MQVLLIRTGGRLWGIPAREVREVLLRPGLLTLPALPPWLEGFFNLEGRAVPVLRADRLLGTGEDSLSLYSHLLLLGEVQKPAALAVERVLELVEVGGAELLPLAGADSFNQAVAAIFERGSDRIPLLSTRRLLLHEEHDRVGYWGQQAQDRLGSAGPE